MGSAGGSAAAAARLHVADFLVGLLPDGRVAGRGHGELERRGAALQQAGQVPAAPARELRALAQVCRVRQVVRQHRQGQLAERVEDTLRRLHLPSECARPRPLIIIFKCQLMNECLLAIQVDESVVERHLGYEVKLCLV
jgi:hypothetical protein